MDSNFEDYKVFYYAAKYGSLTRAASALMTSQPAVTRRIRKLENEWKCRLFTRSKNGVELTPEGQLFYDYISAGCAQFFKGESELSSMVSLENGAIYISATETALHCCLFQAMESFNEKYPDVRFKILNNSTKASIQVLKEGKVDMAVVSAPSHIAGPLKMKRLCSYRDILIGGKRFDNLHGRVVNPEELAGYPWISLTSEAITRNYLDAYFAEYGMEFLPDVELATTDMILPAVRHNMGIGFVPEAFAHADIEAGNVFEIKVNATLPERDVILVYDAEYPQSIASKEFQKFLESGEGNKK